MTLASENVNNAAVSQARRMQEIINKPQKTASMSVETRKLVNEFKPFLEPYGYSEEEVRLVVDQNNGNRDAIQTAVANVVEDRLGHAQTDDWGVVKSKKDIQAQKKADL